MQYQYLKIYEDFFLKRITFKDFQREIKDYQEKISKSELEEFYDYTTDYPFFEFDQDMVMLTYLNLWLLPSRVSNCFPLSGADNMYLSFIKSVKDEYSELNEEPILFNDNFNYLIYQYDKIYLLINTLEFEIDINLPSDLQNTKAFCINCNEEYDLKDKINLYPYGFMIIEKSS